MYSFNYLDKIKDQIDKKIYDERMRYQKIYEIIEEYISKFIGYQNYIIIGGSYGINLLLKNPRSYDDFLYTLYSENAFWHANNLINKIAEHNSDKIIVLKSTIPNVKYQIMIDGRMMIIFHKLQDNSKELILPILIKTNENKEFLILPPEIHLVDIYRILYSPDKTEDWESALLNENKLFKYLNQRINKIIGSSSNDLTRDIRKNIEIEIVKQFIINNPNIVLIGEHALKIICDIKINTNVIQIISNDIEGDFLIISKLVNTILQIPVIKIVRDLYVMQDFRIKRTTIKIGESGNQKEIMYLYNASEYDLIPFNLIYNSKNEKIQVGNPFVLLRFLLIELWIVRMIKQSKLIDENYANFRINELINKLLLLRKKIAKDQKQEKSEINENLFDSFKDEKERSLKIFQSLDSEYLGQYENENIHQKQIIKDLQKKFFDYYPVNYKQKNNTYRVI